MKMIKESYNIITQKNEIFYVAMRKKSKILNLTFCERLMLNIEYPSNEKEFEIRSFGIFIEEKIPKNKKIIKHIQFILMGDELCLCEII